MGHDEVEKVSVERLQAEFYTAETIAEDTESSASGGSGLDTYDRMYRDVNLNLEMPRRVTKKGLVVESHICEVQVTLSGITILKKSEQAVYNLMRMTSSSELAATYVFSSADA